ncbi:uncharacterized protein LOC144052706 [Vanacampus margaritifer]
MGDEKAHLTRQLMEQTRQREEQLYQKEDLKGSTEKSRSVTATDEYNVFVLEEEAGGESTNIIPAKNAQSASRCSTFNKEMLDEKESEVREDLQDTCEEERRLEEDLYHELQLCKQQVALQLCQARTELQQMAERNTTT